jgi:hypothetical protein
LQGGKGADQKVLIKNLMPGVEDEDEGEVYDAQNDFM